MTKRTTVESVCSSWSTFSLTHQDFIPEALHMSPNILIILLHQFQRQYCKKKGGGGGGVSNCDTWERKDKSPNGSVHYC